MKKKNVPVTFSLKEPLLWSTFVQNNGMQILTPNEKKKCSCNFDIVVLSLKKPLFWSTFLQNNGMQILTPSEKKKKKKKFPVTVVLVSFTKVKPSFRETHFHILKVSNG